MAVTRSTAAERAQTRTLRPPERQGFGRTQEFLGMVLAAVVVLTALGLVFAAKRAYVAQPASQGRLNLHDLTRPEQLLPVLTMFASPTDRLLAARKISEYITDHNGNLPNVGALALLHVSSAEIEKTPRLEEFRTRLQAARERHPGAAEVRVPVLTGSEVAALKSQVTVRTAGQFERQFFLWAGLAVFSLLLVHVFWQVRGYTGHQGILPALLILSGVGLVLSVSLRDPLRDVLNFVTFAQGIIGGAVLLAALAEVDYEERFARLSFVPLLGALVLSGLLIVFGSGPTGSDAKVNLGFFQPAEAIKILLIFFLAGYMASRWEFLRELKDRRPGLEKVSQHFAVPRLDYVLPVVFGMVAALLFFFLQRDMGPALLIACTFLILYAVARNKLVLSGVGLLVLVGGFFVGYKLGVPHTVEERVQMWLSPWNNTVRGGDQVVHSLWAFATGGPWGAGIGLGEPQFIPAGYTDLVLAVLGEEWGFVGVLAVFLLYGLLTYLGLRIALRAATDYGVFLGLGLTLLIALQVLLIAGGILDLVPLSGVVSPFLSFGRTAMLANFAIFGILLALSRRPSAPERNAPFVLPIRFVGIGLTVLFLCVVGKAAYVQVLRANEVVGAGTLIIQADGGRRYEYNPRLTVLARQIPRGTIFDRNGLPLATSDPKVIEQNRRALEQAGLAVPVQAKADSRIYPLGGAGFHLLGNVQTHLNWSATNASYLEKDAGVTLQGYDDRARVVEVHDFRTNKPSYTVRYDYRELIPLLRHRYEPDNPEAKRILERNRDVHTSIDARLQWKVNQILLQGLKNAHQTRGAVVVMDPASGDLLASVSYPQPAAETPLDAEADPLGPQLDRARYGLYPPGSTFKVVTALAALRTDPNLVNQTFECTALPDGRAGAVLKGVRRPIRDDVQDRVPHGTLAMDKAITVSCNAYFAQLGFYKLGPQPLLDTAKLMGISVANPDTAKQLKQSLPQASYGQGQVITSPFQLARVAATVAAHGMMPYGRWVTDGSNTRLQAPTSIVAAAQADTLASYMRHVVTSGTGKMLAGATVPVAGKTGTAELANAPSHAWFIGFAPFGPHQGKQIAFAVLVENGQYGGTASAPIAAEIVKAAEALGYFRRDEQ